MKNLYSLSVEWSEEDAGFIALVPEFSGVSAFGETKIEAAQEVEIALQGVLDMLEEEERPLPPARVLAEHSEQLCLPEDLRTTLARDAKKKGVSLNTRLIQILALHYGQSQKIEKLIENIFPAFAYKFNFRFDPQGQSYENILITLLKEFNCEPYEGEKKLQKGDFTTYIIENVPMHSAHEETKYLYYINVSETNYDPKGTTQ